MNIASIAKALSDEAKGRVFKSATWWRCHCPVHLGDTPSLAIRTTPNGGIQVKCWANCSPSSVIAKLKEKGLIDKNYRNQPYEPPDPETEAKDRTRRIERAAKIWSECYEAPIIQEYLKSRMINTPVPDTIRYHPSLYHHEQKVSRLAMVALVTHPTEGDVGIHATYLKPYGRGKADLSPNKRMIGAVAGAAVQLTQPTDTVAICEGIETALSYMEATNTPTWAALSISGIRNLTLPTTIQHVILAPDADPAGILAAQAAAKRFLREGRKVSIDRPPLGMDFNDLARSAQ